MKKGIIALIVSISVANHLPAQKIYVPELKATDSSVISHAFPKMAMLLLEKYKEENQRVYLNNLFPLQIITEKYRDAIKTIEALRSIARANNSQYPELLLIQYELFAKTKIKQSESGQAFNDAFADFFNETYGRLSDQAALYVYTAFLTRSGIEELEKDFRSSLNNNSGKDSLEIPVAINITRSFFLFNIYNQIEPIAKKLIREDDNRRYVIKDSVLIQTAKNAWVSAYIAQKRNMDAPQPAALFFTIYADTISAFAEAKWAAAYGYVGVVADTRGKRLSPNEIEPYETEVNDVTAVIDWISKQPWCNGKVGMYGGSYTGYAQWAATKKMHPALKTIVPYVAAIPGYGLPMDNNIFLNANYAWAFYVTNNKYLDTKTYNQPQRWNGMMERWYTSGVAYRKIDSVDGTPNKWLQRWLQHPSFDSYWQQKIPFKEDYARINIPVLTITGYYDDGQISALQYLKEHYKYNKTANHYLVIGPYDHFGAQRGGVSILRDYVVDRVALINTKELTFQWMDYIMKNGKKPGLIKDKINYEVMGANEWKYAPSLEKLQEQKLAFYLTNEKSGNYYKLSSSKPAKESFIMQEVDLADRKTTNNTDYYPFPIITKELSDTTGLHFISDPVEEPYSINGCFSGNLNVNINKKDMDIGVVLYEVMPDGKIFHLSYYLGRASYAADITKRKLLLPGVKESIAFDRTRMTSRQLSKGSRLLVVLNINKNSFAQVNYGTGKDVSDETIKDAKEPLRIKWFNDSVIKVPVRK